MDLKDLQTYRGSEDVRRLFEEPRISRSGAEIIHRLRFLRSLKIMDHIVILQYCTWRKIFVAREAIRATNFDWGGLTSDPKMPLKIF